MSYEIHAIHREGSEPVIETGERFISAFEGDRGDAWVLSVDRGTHEGTLMSNDIDEPHPVDPDSPYGDLILGAGEVLWLKACWMTILRTDPASIDRLFREATARLAKRMEAVASTIN